MSKLKKKQSLAEKINDIITDGPKTFDSDDEDEVTKAKVVDQHSESDSDVAQTGTSFRKQNVHLLDEVDARYQGKKVSRKDIYENEASDDDGDLESDEDSDEALENLCDMDSDNESEQETDNNSDDAGDNDDNEEDVNDDDDDQVETGDDEDYSDDEEESDFDEDNPLGRNRNGENNFPSMTPININQEIEKGNCVRNQLKLWENMLEMRIKLQKCLSTSNKMPQYDTIKEYQTDKSFNEAAQDAKKNITSVLDGLLELQEKLWKNNPETKNLLSKNKESNDKIKTDKDDPMDEEIPSDTDEEIEQDNKDESNDDDDNDTNEPANKKRKTLAEYEKILDKRHKAYSPYRNSVIQKWNDKTRVATGNASKGTSQAVVKQIEFLLNNKQKMISRTQLKRSEYSIIGKEDTDNDDNDGRRVQEYDTEIYDDDDFYHQLLRELIEHKSADITDPIQLGKQWVQLQNMRTKMKRKIDTRATKGRRVRYNVHTKLVNFMAPNPVTDTWSDLAKTELYNSLFGNIKVVQNKNQKNNVTQDVEV